MAEPANSGLTGLRLLIVFSILLVVVLVAGGAYALDLVARRTDSAVFVHARNLHDCDTMAEAFERKLAAWRGYLLTGDPQLLAERDAADATVRAKLDALRPRLSGRDEGLLRAIERASATHERASSELEAGRRAGADLSALAEEWRHVGRPLADDVRAAVDELRTSLERHHARAEAVAANAERNGLIIFASITLGVLILGGIGGSVLVRAARARKLAEVRLREEITARLAAETVTRTEAETARNFFGALLDELPIGFIAAEASSGRILHVSANALSILRQQSAPATDDIDLDAAWKTATHLDGTPCAAGELPLARALRGETIHGEELRTSDGRIVLCSAAPIRGDGGETVAAALAFIDATEKHHGEAERELFLGALGHDLRNPLSAISMSASSLSADAAVDDRTRRHGARIVNASKRMMRLIDQLLDFVQSRHGSLPMNPARCDLHDVARDVIATMELGNPDCTIHLERHGRGVGAWDRDRMAQVLQNLIGNALQHGEPGTAVIVRIDDCGSETCVDVINHGKPIPRPLLPHLFEPFRRGPTGSGLGLGLYIAHAIVTAHRGTIEATSSETTRFRVRLPNAPAADAAAAS